MEALKHHVVNLEKCGPVSVFIQGDLTQQRDGAVFLTVHDIGSSYQSWVAWVNHSSMEEVRKKALFLHVCIPGQEPGAEDLPVEFPFPRMQELGLNLVTVLDHLRVSRVVGLGDGAGANILTRFGMCHASRVFGIVGINTTASSSKGRFMETLKDKIKVFKINDKSELNERNVSKFAEAYRKRTDLLVELNKKISFDVLLLTGTNSRYVGDTEAIHQTLDPGICSIIKVEDVVEPLQETPAKVAEAVILFCQGLCLIPAVAAKITSSGEGSSVKSGLLMRDYDRPNIRRLSLTPF